MVRHAATSPSAWAWQATTPWPWSSRFLLAVGVVLVLHAVLLMPLQFSMAGGPAIAATPRVTVRMVAAPAAADPPLSTPTTGETLAADDPSLAPAQRVPSTESAGRAQPTARVETATSEGAAKPAAAAASAAPVARTSLPPGPPPAPNYLLGGSLDPGPRPLHDITPVYPPRAGQQQGVVVLRLLINEQGVVDNVAVVRSAPAGYFEESALEAFGTARFSPGLMLGMPVKSQVTIEVEFIPINRGASVSGKSY